ncbi:ComEC/Rec2 family competence protein [Candidatus Contubernalis alkaliaceticus]|uniref:ComEC/Rec2 family competence protein n=1 Tax=Candidatus Contubernalis alkaliaceticus TaxID=338645 RepID=UPI001F4C4BC1|nr:MBL fold metallo-hydrolase [Candidatus Contubernalis alkalaceticus]UNC91977.1 MBL fold metallo-hydrolase [Candidatus Contubernalis alkalaceticus]
MKKTHIFILSFLLILLLLSGCGNITTDKIINSLEEIVMDVLDSPVDSDPETIQEPADPEYQGQLQVHFIDVGQGDAIFIKSPSHNILIDGGERGNTVLNYLEEQGIDELHLVIGTHPHSDHIGGLINILESMPVTEVIDSGAVHTTKTFEDYLEVIDKKEIKYTEGRAGLARHLGSGVSMQILHPSQASGSNLNDSSIVVKLTFGKISFMFTGDAEEASEKAILKRGYNLKSTFLKVGHHGSSTSTTDSFLSALDADAAIIMVGENNEYGFPHHETLSKLNDAHIDIYMTSVHGTIVITTDGQTYDINVKQPYQYTKGQESEPEPEPDEPSEN